MFVAQSLDRPERLTPGKIEYDDVEIGMLSDKCQGLLSIEPPAEPRCPARSAPAKLRDLAEHGMIVDDQRLHAAELYTTPGLDKWTKSHSRICGPKTMLRLSSNVLIRNELPEGSIVSGGY